MNSFSPEFTTHNLLLLICEIVNEFCLAQSPDGFQFCVCVDLFHVGEDLQTRKQYSVKREMIIISEGLFEGSNCANLDSRSFIIMYLPN